MRNHFDRFRFLFIILRWGKNGKWNVINKRNNGHEVTNLPRAKIHKRQTDCGDISAVSYSTFVRPSQSNTISHKLQRPSPSKGRTQDLTERCSETQNPRTLQKSSVKIVKDSVRYRQDNGQSVTVTNKSMKNWSELSVGSGFNGLVRRSLWVIRVRAIDT